MDKIKVIKIFLIVASILCILLLVRLLILKISNDELNTTGGVIVEEDIKLSAISNYSNYFSINGAISKYYMYINSKNAEAVYNILNKEYISKNKISIQNVFDKVETISLEEPEFSIKKGYVETKGTISIYCIYGILEDTIPQEKYLIVNVDDVEHAFEILPIDQKMYENVISQKAKITGENVQQNEFNKITLITMTDESVATLLFRRYKQIMMKDVKQAYNLLENEYKNKKFSTQEEFEKYIIDNDIKRAMISAFEKERMNNCTIYRCVDQNGNIYIFNETAIMDYTVMLDEYTIPTEEFINKYNVSNDNEKIALNIDKFFKAINDKSYYFAYNLLAESFRNNYFKTQEEFENYIQNSFYNKNKISYKDCSMESGLYKCKIDITNAEDMTKSTEKIIIMQLNEGTKFEMSFNLN